MEGKALPVQNGREIRILIRASLVLDANVCKNGRA
jgi:hypothetical protein